MLAACTESKLSSLSEMCLFDTVPGEQDVMWVCCDLQQRDAHASYTLLVSGWSGQATIIDCSGLDLLILMLNGGTDVDVHVFWGSWRGMGM